jgi:quinol monooxygenase YgiN
MIVINAIMKSKEGSGDELEKIIKTYAPKFRQDPGCLQYRAHRKLDNPNMFFFYEQYENDEALKYHSTSPNFKEMFGAMKSLLDGRSEIGLYKEI